MQETLKASNHFDSIYEVANGTGEHSTSMVYSPAISLSLTFVFNGANRTVRTVHV